jgi:lipopolysaccharide export system ATP-binding protein
MTLVFYSRGDDGAMSTLRAEGLVKRYGRRTVVKGISLSVSSGETIGLLGRNGAGKTTTFEMLAGLVTPDGGVIRLDDAEISSWTTPERGRRGLIYLPQESSVFLKTSVEKNILMILEGRPGDKAEKRAFCQRLLEGMGLSSLAGQPADKLSGGEKRRVEIARALALEPKFLLLDEPFTGIDPLTIEHLQRIFSGLRDRGIGLVVSDHNVRDTLSIVSRAYVIDGGEILAEGPPEVVATDERVLLRFLGKDFRSGDATPANPVP